MAEQRTVVHGMHPSDLCIAYLSLLTRVYWLLSEPSMDYYKQLLVPGSTSAYFKGWGAAFAGIGLLHLLDMMQTMYHGAVSTQRRLSIRLIPAGPELETTTSWTQHSRRVFALDEPIRQQSVRGQAALTSSVRVRRSIDAINSFSATVVSRFEVFGVQSRYFHVLFLSREWHEIAAQSYQVYRMSMLLASTSINGLAVTLLVLNCWSTPILHYVFRDHQVWARVSCVLCDGILNMGTSMVLPFVVFLPYGRAFIPDDSMHLPLDMLYVEVEFTNLVAENKSVFVATYLDGFFKIVSHLAIYLCFRTIRSVVGSNTQHMPCAQDVDIHTVIPIEFKGITEPSPTRSKRWVYRMIHRLAGTLFCIAGAVILMLYAFARQRMSSLEAPMGCLQTMHPWVATNYSCAAFEFNYMHHQVESPDAAA